MEWNLANKITFSRIMMIPFFMLFIIPLPDWTFLSGFNNFASEWGVYIAATIFVLAAATDAIDGHIARKRNLVSDFGRFIDPIADKLLIMVAVIALVQLGELSGWIAAILIGRELTITGFRLIITGKGIVLSANIWGKLKMVLQTIAIVILMIEIRLIEHLGLGDWILTLGEILMFTAVVATIVSGYIYIKQNFHLLIEGSSDVEENNC